jgi:hypothetical protein
MQADIDHDHRLSFAEVLRACFPGCTMAELSSYEHWVAQDEAKNRRQGKVQKMANSRRKFQAAAAKLGPDGKPKAEVQLTAEQDRLMNGLFDMYDENGDDALTMEELLSKMSEKSGVTQCDIEELFAVEGKTTPSETITRPEFVKLFGGMICGDVSLLELMQSHMLRPAGHHPRTDDEIAAGIEANTIKVQEGPTALEVRSAAAVKRATSKKLTSQQLDQVRTRIKAAAYAYEGRDLGKLFSQYVTAPLPLLLLVPRLWATACCFHY